MYRSIVIIEVFLGAVCLVLGVLILGFQYEPFPGSVITLLVAVLLLGALSLVGAAKAPLFSAPSNSYRPTLAQQWFFTGATLFLLGASTYVSDNYMFCENRSSSICTGFRQLAALISSSSTHSSIAFVLLLSGVLCFLRGIWLRKHSA